MMLRLNRMFLYAMLLFLCGGCSSDEVAVNPPSPTGEELSFVAAIGKESSRTIYTEEADAANNNRPYLKALWGGANETVETISLYTADGTFCGEWKATIEAGGNATAEFSGVLEYDELIPEKAYYSKSSEISSLSDRLDLTAQKQGESGSTAHLSGQDFMEGTVTMPAEGTADPGSINFLHLTAVIKYTLNFTDGTQTVTDTDTESESPTPLLLDLLSLKQVSGDPVLQLTTSFDGTASACYSSLDLTFREDNGMVSVPVSDHTLVAYTSVFPSQTKDVKYTLFARATTGLYETDEFTINQNFDAGKLYTITINMNRLTQYDWYFNPEVDDEGNYTYTITNADELAAFSKIVNGDAGLKLPDSFEDKTVRMANDISLEDYQPWTPIGKSESTPFKGTFDGGGHTVSDLKTDETKDYQGFFGFVDGATIQNLTVEGEVKGQNYVGAIAAKAVNSTFKDCTFGRPNIQGLSISGLSWVGAIIGYAEGSIFEYCINNGEVRANAPNAYVGGIGGYGYDSGLRGCSNYGSVILEQGGIGGGLMGFMDGGSISGCANHGETESMAGEMYSIIGSIIGKMANEVRVIGSYSDGSIDDYGYGIGYGDGIISGSYYTDGQGDSEYFRDSITQDDIDAMNAALADQGTWFDEDGNPINFDPTDFGNGNVEDFNGGGYLQ